MMKQVLGAGFILASMVGFVAAQGDVIAARKDGMKAAGAGMANLAKMVKGESPFDAAAAQAVFKAHADGATKFVTLFPDNSKTGGETAALPAIWEKKADFEAAAKKWNAAATDAAAKVKDLDSLKAVMADYGKNCGGCHEPFRAKKS